MGYETLKLRTGNGGNIANVMRKNGRFLMDMEIENDVSCAPDIFICDGIVPKKPITIRIYENKYGATDGFTVKFSVKIGDSLKIGDLLYDCDENVYWICKNSHKNGGIYCSGTLQRCVDMPLKWQDDDGNIFEYPVFDYSQFSSDETDYNIVNVGEGRRRLTTIADDNTVKLKHDKRFFWDRNTEKPSVFKVTQNNSTSLFYDKGLVQITIIEDQYNPEKDNIEEWICDYITPKSNAPLLEWNGDDSIRIGRSRRVWVDTEETVEWDIRADNSISVEYDGNSVKITVPLDERLIGGFIHITATVNGEKSECEFEIIGGV